MKSLNVASGFSQPTLASPRELEHGAFRRLRSRNLNDPRLDVDGGAEGSHVIWNLPEDSVP